MAGEALKLWKDALSMGFENTNAYIRKGRVPQAPGIVSELPANSLETTSEVKPNLNRDSIAKGLRATGSYIKACVPKDALLKGFETTTGFLKGSQMFKVLEGNKLITKITTTGKVHILDKATKTWIFRLDKAHKGANFNHININKKFSGLRTDPHTPLPVGTLKAGKEVAKLCKVMNKANEILVPVAIAVDTYLIGASAVDDYHKGTTRNTFEMATKCASGWTGGYVGGTAGMAVGTAILPGMGTIIGGLIGAVGGGVAMAVTADSMVNKIGDAYSYNMTKAECVNCEKKYDVRKYKGEEEKKKCNDC